MKNDVAMAPQPVKSADLVKERIQGISTHLNEISGRLNVIAERLYGAYPKKEEQPNKSVSNGWVEGIGTIMQESEDTLNRIYKSLEIIEQL